MDNVLLGIFEVLEKADKAETEDQKIKILRENTSPGLRRVLLCAYDSRVTWALPEGPVPYKPSHSEGLETAFHKATDLLYLFLNDSGVSADYPQIRREQKFIETLESIHPEDAKLLLSIKDKKLPYKTLTIDLIDKAFPNMLEWDKKSFRNKQTTKNSTTATKRKAKAKAKKKSTRSRNNRSTIKTTVNETKIEVDGQVEQKTV